MLNWTRSIIADVMHDCLYDTDFGELLEKVQEGMYSAITHSEILSLVAEVATHLTIEDPCFEVLGGRIAMVSVLREICDISGGESFAELKALSPSFSETISELCEYRYDENHRSFIRDDVKNFVVENGAVLDSAIREQLDFDYSYFAISTLSKSYLMKINNRIVERPQHMLMRVACGLWTGDIHRVLETYQHMSNGNFTHASPTLFGCGVKNAALSSCFLLTSHSDSIGGIFKTLSDCALISKHAGGIGLSMSSIRSKGSYIRGTNGSSDGIVPMLRVFDSTSRYVNQSGRRKGAFSIYLEPWHADILDFLSMRRPNGPEELRGRNLFYAMWIPDLFMKRVEENSTWSLMCPDKCIGLQDSYGDEFEKLYLEYERLGWFVRQITAREVWWAMVTTQIETGMPYMCYKDSVNAKSNHQNMGVIRSSNLCTEIMQYSSPEETACCNLGSIALPKFVLADGKGFDHVALHSVTEVLARNLDRVIDTTYYPTEESKRSNLRSRPIAVGVQGLADLFIDLNIDYDSEEARKLNREIFETIYHACLNVSNSISMECGPYPAFEGSPISRGIFQFDMWENGASHLSGRWDWDDLRKRVVEHGVRNSLVTAPMPTASTAQILGNTESFEPLSSNIYVRRTLAGEFVVVNQRLLRTLRNLGIWGNDVREQLIYDEGSIANIPTIPDIIKKRFRTVWEIKMRNMMQMAGDRGIFIDQSQSMNCYMANPTAAKITSMHMYAWKLGLKTGMYYLRTKAATKTTPFTLGSSFLKNRQQKQTVETTTNCHMDRDGCTSCSG